MNNQVMHPPPPEWRGLGKGVKCLEKNLLGKVRKV